jgi:predicted O-linked N-acetylglucosamine transferase (SPINDLY family)
VSGARELQTGRQALLSGDPQTACSVLQALVEAEPANHEARYWLASARLTAGQADLAAQAMDDARILHTLALARGMGADVDRCRSEPVYAADVANRLYAERHVAMSGVLRAMALSKGGVDATGLLSYGLALQHQGRTDEAAQVFHAAAENFPSAPVHQFLLYPLLLGDDGEARYAAEARAWARLYAPALPVEPHRNPSLAGRKLRIGYLAPNFGGTQVRQFITPLLENHDPARVSVTLYPAVADTETDWPSWIDIHPIGKLNDADAANLIRADQIDVLADCWGHSAGSRLALVGRRPAPVQVGWINFVQTTGLDQVDYILHADTSPPPVTEGLFTEAIWPIGPVFNAFRAGAGRLPPTPTPALRTGQVTFGSFNHPVKLNDWALDGWAAVLRAAPSSRLLLKYGYFADPVLQRVTQARFAARGVAPDRLAFAGHSAGAAYFEAFGEVDLMLDAWPAPGSTTTLDALSNGVPVLTMAGSPPSVGGAYARSILEAAGLPELVTASPEAFVERALELTSDAQRLDALRARVRPGFDNGPLCDDAGFTLRIETAFGEMFECWRQGRQAARGAA